MKHLTLLSLILLLGACVPQNTSQNPQKPPLVEGPVSFYPAQPGLDWTYLPQRATPVDPTYRVSILGSWNFNGQVGIRYRFSGRGQERYYYRQVGSGGVLLLGFEEAITNTAVRFNPPMQEYPPEASLAVGARWGGATRVVTDLTVDNKTSRISEASLEYSYSVIGKSVVNVAAGTFEVFRILLELRSGQNAKEEYEIWFTPRVGEVKTREGLQLVERNFK